MSSRNSLANRQSIASSHNAGRSSNQASNLIADTRLAPHMQISLVKDEQLTQPVHRCRAMEPLFLARVSILPGQIFYYVQSKHKYWSDADHRYYHYYFVLLGEGSKWICSSPDERTVALCIARVKQYRAELLARQAMREAA